MEHRDGWTSGDLRRHRGVLKVVSCRPSTTAKIKNVRAGYAPISGWHSHSKTTGCLELEIFPTPMKLLFTLDIGSTAQTIRRNLINISNEAHKFTNGGNRRSMVDLVSSFN